MQAGESEREDRGLSPPDSFEASQPIMASPIMASVSQPFGSLLLGNPHGGCKSQFFSASRLIPSHFFSHIRFLSRSFGFRLLSHSASGFLAIRLLSHLAIRFLASWLLSHLAS